ncbi:ATP synthase F0 subunit 8 (mitochondrion) [Macrobrachium nipponense]|uniref:ATP synthase complex subunit 8 n=1 Tax=Macrobrachium nipponense TaxID=159736 RepID=E7EL54_MACNP|nr:ATP synthase F0 subunit 8 [Macrobrachium nipponense]ADV30205.1 ATP synthase FO subunit 8 [Macrobrachium nipponense]UVU21222.1 ATP synthase F0 subunit 8 [Macrobrachium nipponense]
MPQMAPLLWLNLYVFFTVVLTLIIISSYFIKTPIKVDSNLTITKTNQANWKW